MYASGPDEDGQEDVMEIAVTLPEPLFTAVAEYVLRNPETIGESTDYDACQFGLERGDFTFWLRWLISYKEMIVECFNAAAMQHLPGFQFNRASSSNVPKGLLARESMLTLVAASQDNTSYTGAVPMICFLNDGTLRVTAVLA